MIADSLSRDFHVNSHQLTHAFRTLLPNQTPKNFIISTLPPETVSWIHSLWQHSTRTQVSRRQPARSKLGLLTDGSDSCEEWESKTNGLRDIMINKKCTSCPRLQAAADEMNMTKQDERHSQAKPSKPSSRMLVHPFGRLSEQTQPSIEVVNRPSFSADN